MRIITSVVMLASFGLLAPSAAFAYNDDGHQIIALIADHYLLPQTRDKVNALLASDTDKLTAHDIAGAATWADKYAESDKATTHQRYDQTSGWHFAAIGASRPNILQACFGQKPLTKGMAASQGPAKDCVVDKIEQFSDELADSATPQTERLLALKYLLNLVGDIHQPLRVADEGNSFGQKTAVAAPSVTPGDLFTLWDSVVISRLEQTSSPHAVARLLIARISDEDQRLWASRTPQLWALEAHQLGVDYAYGMVGNFDDQFRSIVEASQMDKAVKITANQLSRAGVRLAFVLNQAFASTPLPTNLTEPSPGNAVAGAAFARVVCGVCHVTTAGQEKPTTAPDFSVIAKTKGVNESALREFLLGTHPTMPNMHLSEKQTDNAIAYILSLKDK